jgi:hypothetical protein
MQRGTTVTHERSPLIQIQANPGSARVAGAPETTLLSNWSPGPRMAKGIRPVHEYSNASDGGRPLASEYISRPSADAHMPLLVAQRFSTAPGPRAIDQNARRRPSLLRHADFDPPVVPRRHREERPSWSPRVTPLATCTGRGSRIPAAMAGAKKMTASALPSTAIRKPVGHRHQRQMLAEPAQVRVGGAADSRARLHGLTGPCGLHYSESSYRK